MPQTYTVRDSQSGKTVTFYWNDPDNPPTEDDLAEVFAEANQAESEPLRPIASHEPPAPPEDFSRFGPMRVLYEAQARPMAPGQLPMVGGMAGAVLGGPLGAAAGGATGALGRDLLRAYRGDPETPRTALAAAGNVGADAAMQGALSKGGELVGRGVAAGGRWLASRAEPAIRSAVKPLVSMARKQAGATQSGLDAAVRPIVNLIRTHRITKPEQAEALIQKLEQQIQGAVTPAANATQSVLTDAPSRAARYLQTLERSAGKQGLPADDVAAVRGAETELRSTSPLSQDVRRTVMQPSPSGLVNPAGQPVQVPVTVTSRALRANVQPEEALALARSSGKWGNKKQWGEQKSASTESSKAVERALRDSVKAAVPEAAPLLRQQGVAIRTKDALDRMQFREGNRDQFSLPGVVAAAPAVAQGRIPFLGLMAQWLRNNQLRAGLMADTVGPAIARTGRRLSESQLADQMTRLALLAQLEQD